MSVRLYYDDAYTVEFTARITAQYEIEGRPAVVLDRTFFYPESGGQPPDRGWLNETAVSNVTLHPTYGLLHWLDAPLPPTTDEVNGRINWPRRFDHMQQHTGQHILSQAFIQTANAETVGFHLTDDNLTIDLSHNNLSPADINAAETLANQIVWQNRPIRSRFVTVDQAKQVGLRKLPDLENGPIRLIEIEDFDLTACGGTHVAHTGEVGLIKVIKQERRGDQLRLSFVCGQRAWQDYSQKQQVIDSLMSRLTTAATELDPAIATLQAELKQAKRQIKQQATQLAAAEAEQLWQTAVIHPHPTHDQLRLISHVFTDRDPGQLRQLASQLAQRNNSIILFGLAGDKAQLIFARTTDAPGDMKQLLPQALALISPDARGGGSPLMAQGGGPAADPNTIRQALNRAQQILLDTL